MRMRVILVIGLILGLASHHVQAAGLFATRFEHRIGSLLTEATQVSHIANQQGKLNLCIRVHPSAFDQVEEATIDRVLSLISSGYRNWLVGLHGYKGYNVSAIEPIIFGFALDEGVEMVDSKYTADISTGIYGKEISPFKIPIFKAKGDIGCPIACSWQIAKGDYQNCIAHAHANHYDLTVWLTKQSANASTNTAQVTLDLNSEKELEQQLGQTLGLPLLGDGKILPAKIGNLTRPKSIMSDPHQQIQHFDHEMLRLIWNQEHYRYASHLFDNSQEGALISSLYRRTGTSGWCIPVQSWKKVEVKYIIRGPWLDGTATSRLSDEECADECLKESTWCISFGNSVHEYCALYAASAIKSDNEEGVQCYTRNAQSVVLGNTVFLASPEQLVLVILCCIILLGFLYMELKQKQKEEQEQGRGKTTIYDVGTSTLPALDDPLPGSSDVQKHHTQL